MFELLSASAWAELISPDYFNIFSYPLFLESFYCNFL